MVYAMFCLISKTCRIISDEFSSFIFISKLSTIIERNLMRLYLKLKGKLKIHLLYKYCDIAKPLSTLRGKEIRNVFTTDHIQRRWNRACTSGRCTLYVRVLWTLQRIFKRKKIRSRRIIRFENILLSLHIWHSFVQVVLFAV